MPQNIAKTSENPKNQKTQRSEEKLESPTTWPLFPQVFGFFLFFWFFGFSEVFQHVAQNGAQSGFQGYPEALRRIDSSGSNGGWVCVDEGGRGGVLFPKSPIYVPQEPSGCQ